MGVSPVQHRSSSANGVSSFSLAFSSSNAAGNLLIYETGWFLSVGNNANAATDSNTNTIVNAIGPINGPASTQTIRADYVASSHAGANTVTAHAAQSTDGHLHIWEVSGCSTTSPLRDTGSVANSATASVSTSGSTSLTGDAVLAFFYDNVSNAALTAGSGYNPSELSSDATGGDAALSEFKVATAGGTQTATCGGNSTDTLGQLIVTFIAASNVSAPLWSQLPTTPGHAI